MSYLFDNYLPLPVHFKQGNGCWLTDTNNKQYLDALSGVGVVNLGHCHPVITQTITTQAKTLIHTSNWYHNDHQANLAKKLCQLTQMEKVFFTNSGAEANETAIKLTRLYARQQKIVNPVILTAKNSFHGRTMATLSATGNSKIQHGFAPLLSDFIHLDFDDIDAIKAHQNNPNIVALMLEPIMGEAGVIIPEQTYLNKAQAICQQNDWLLILDEVQTGIGRTGQLFAHQANQIVPDILTSAKGLGNGLPIGACLGGQKVAHLLILGSHGTTYGGNPLCTAVGLSVLEIIEKNAILDNVNTMSAYFLSQASLVLQRYPIVQDIRAKGLMLAITLDKVYLDLMIKALDLGILIHANGKHIRLLPPLIINQNEMDTLIQKLNQLIGTLP